MNRRSRRLFLAGAFLLIALAVSLTPLLAQVPEPVQRVTTIAGKFDWDGRDAATSPIFPSGAVAFGPDGLLYINGYVSVLRVEEDGTLTRVAGRRSVSSSGDGGPATAATFGSFGDLVFDADGNLLIPDTFFYKVRIVENGIITTLAGTGELGYSGDGGPASQARIGQVYGMDVDAAGNIYIADFESSTIRRIDTSGIITTIAGGGNCGYSGDGGQATAATLCFPEDVKIAPSGEILIADTYNNVVRSIDSMGVITTIAGDPAAVELGDGGSPTAAMLSLPAEVEVDAAGRIFISEENGFRIRLVENNVISTYAGTGESGYSGDGGPAAEAMIGRIYGLRLDGAGNLYVSDTNNNRRLRRIDTSEMIDTVAGIGTNFFGEGIPALEASLSPRGVAVGPDGSVYFTDGSFSQRIRVVNPAGIVSTYAGTGMRGTAGDGGPALSAEFDTPRGLHLNASGDLLVTEYARVRRISSAGIVSTIAGNGELGYSGDGGPATSASLSFARAVVESANGDIFFSDTSNHIVRRIDANGVITTYAGTPQTAGFSGDGGPAASAQLISPEGLAFGQDGALYIADRGNNRVRRVSVGGTISTYAGSGTARTVYFQDHFSDGNFTADPAWTTFEADTETPAVLDVVDDGFDGPAFHVSVPDFGDEFYREDGIEITRSIQVTDATFLRFDASPKDKFIGEIPVEGCENFPINVDVVMSLADESTVTFRYAVSFDAALFDKDEPALVQRSAVIAQGSWGSFEYRLRDAFADAVEILSIRAFGAGCSYEGHIDNIHIEDDGDGDGAEATQAPVFSPDGVAFDSNGDLWVTENSRIRKIPSAFIIGGLETIETILGDGIAGDRGDGEEPILARTSLTLGIAIDAEDSVYFAGGGNASIRKIFTFIEPVAQVPVEEVSEETAGVGPNAQTGSSVSAAGDLNGDGIADLITGAPGFNVESGPLGAGAAAVFFGSGSEAERANADITFVGEKTNDRAGTSVAGDFDFNGDGIPDLLIGAEQVDRSGPAAPAATGPGRVYLIYFDPTDLTHYPNIGNPLLEDIVDLALVGVPGGIPGVVFEGEAFGDRVGTSVDGGGRFNPGSGQDIGIGAPGFDAIAGINAGAAYVIYDDPALSGLVSLTRVASGLPDEVPGFRYRGEGAGDELGFDVSFPGDVVEPAGDDFAMGAPLADPDVALDDPIGDAGSVYIDDGGDSDTGDIEVCSIGGGDGGAVIVGDQEGEEIGFSVGGGDDNLKNGEDDTLIGAPKRDSDPTGSTDGGIDAGRVVQIAGRLPTGVYNASDVGADPGTNPNAIEGAQYLGALAGDQLGFDVASAGDVTNNDNSDIVLGAPGADPNGSNEAGIVYLVEGQDATGEGIFQQIPVETIGSLVDGRQIAGTQEGEMAGSALAGIGDVNEDGSSDFAIGSPGRDQDAEEDTGTVHLVLETNELATENPLDNQAPTADAGADQILECEGGGVATAALDGSGSSDPNSDLLTFEWLEGGAAIATGETTNVVLAVGTHVLTLRVTDPSGLFSEDSVTIDVVDTTGPSIDCPANAIQECEGDLAAAVTLPPASAADSCGDVTSFTNNYNGGGADASGSYPLGTTIVGFQAADGDGNVSSCSTAVDVVDTLAPTVTVIPSPETLWPPNHALRDVHFMVTVSDICDPAPRVELLDIVSDEPDDNAGGTDGATTGDIQMADLLTADFDVQLRAERDGKGGGRTYTVRYRATDSSGNVGIGTATVFVPHDQGNGADPISTSVTRDTLTEISWYSDDSSDGYDVIRGNLSDLRIQGQAILLGAATCLASQTTALSTVESATTEEIPPPNSGWFYLIQYRQGKRDSGYGSVSADYPRKVDSGGCGGN